MNEGVTLSLTGNKTSLFSNYFPPINVHEDSEIALLCLQTYNTFPNINETNNEVVILIQDNSLLSEDNFIIKVPIGCFEFDALKKRILNIIDEYNKKSKKIIEFEIKLDNTTFKTSIKCNYPIDFSISNSIASIFGFEKKVYNAKTEWKSEKPVDINPINSIKVICNIAQGSFNNSQPSHTIHEFFPNGVTGTKIVERPAT